MHTFHFLWLKVTHTFSRDMSSMNAVLVLLLLVFCFFLFVPNHFVASEKTMDSTQRSSLWKWCILATGERGDWKVCWHPSVSCSTENSVPIIRLHKRLMWGARLPTVRVRALYKYSHELRLFILFYQSAHMSYFRKRKTVIYKRKSICILSILIKS